MILELLGGVLGPLAAATASWMLIERTYRRDPAQVTALMTGAFFVKMLFFGAYVVGLIAAGLRPAPFVISFTAAFIASYAIEAVALHRMFSEISDCRGKIADSPYAESDVNLKSKI